MAEWIGNGLQNLLRRFESALDVVVISTNPGKIRFWLDLSFVDESQVYHLAF